MESQALMHLTLLLTTCGTLACANLAPQDEPPTPPKTEVYVMGMIHSGHRTSELYSLDTVRSMIRSINPDVICTEIPPANWPSTLATWNQKHIVDDSRVSVFPEYTDALMPLLDELHFTVEPCAAWTPEMASARSARIKQFSTSPEDAAANAAYRADQQALANWLEANPAAFPEDDPTYIHSPAYDQRTKRELGPYETHLNEVIGAPGGWTYINQGHFDLIEAAITKHPGKRILVTFGAGHKYWFLEQLRSMEDVTLMDVRNHIPDLARDASPPQTSDAIPPSAK